MWPKQFDTIYTLYETHFSCAGIMYYGTYKWNFNLSIKNKRISYGALCSFEDDDCIGKMYDFGYQNVASETKKVSVNTSASLIYRGPGVLLGGGLRGDPLLCQM